MWITLSTILPYFFLFEKGHQSVENTPNVMTILANKDYLEVRLASLIADYDRETLANLYQPIIGYVAMALYNTLWSEANNQKVMSLATHEQIFKRMQISAGKYIEARKTLEAAGLLKTYVDDSNNVNLYHYELYAPKTPASFFNDALLFGLLIQHLGTTDANKLKGLYRIEQDESSYGKDISAPFAEVFHPEFDDPSFMEAASNQDKSIGHNSAKIKGQFSYEIFFKELSKISQITEVAFLKKDMKEIDRLATLYGVNEESAANAVSNIYDVRAQKGKRIDFAKLAEIFQDETHYAYLAKKKSRNGTNLVSSESDLASKINLMEKISPKDYLTILQGGSKPASADLRLINDLSKDFNLPNCVINAVIDFVLTMNNNIFSRAYSEKISASLAREGVETTLDAMNYLRKVSKSKKPTNGGNKNQFNKVTSSKEESLTKESSKKEDEDLNWNQLLDDIDEGGSDGKA